MSPRERNRNVPLSWWPLGRSPIGKDGDECEGIDAGVGVESREGGDVDAEIVGGTAARGVSAGEAVGPSVPGGGREGIAAPERGAALESCTRGDGTPAGA